MSKVLSNTLRAAQVASQFRDNDMALVRQCLPAHMMFLMMEEARKKGWTMRMDVSEKLNNASVAPLVEQDPMTISRVATKVDNFARTLLRDLSANDPVEGLFCCAMFVLVLVDEGYVKEARSMAVLVALMLNDDAKDDNADVNGVLPEFTVREQKWRAGAKTILNRSVLLGIFDRTVQ